MSFDPTRNGAAQAATLSIAIAALVTALVKVVAVPGSACASVLSAVVEALPGAPLLGDFAALETLLVAVWLVSWALLHRLLRRTELTGTPFMIVFLVLIGLATTLWWPPVLEAVRARP